MRLRSPSLALLQVVLIIAPVAIECGQSEFSTHFVLETADSNESSHEPPVVEVKRKAEESAASTHIVSEEQQLNIESSGSNQNKRSKQQTTSHNNNNSNKQKNHSSQPETSTRHLDEEESPSSSSSSPSFSNSKQINNSDDATKARDLGSFESPEEEEGVQRTPKSAAQTRGVIQSRQPPSPSGRPRVVTQTSTTTTERPYNGNANSNQDDYHEPQQHSSLSNHQTTTKVPKNQERLLISISSNNHDNEDGYGSLHKTTSSSLSDDHLQVQQASQQPQQQKRKPSITISIQDASIHKNNDGSAVIVRPGEDGQSIVIATVGSSSLIHHNNNNNNNNNNAHHKNEQKPSPGGSGQDPYREPLNNPIASIIAQHHPTSTTRRPSENNVYVNNNQPSRPITSTLVDGNHARPTNEERPQRPAVQADDNYGEGQRPTARPPSRPIQQQDNPYENTYDPQQQQQSRPTSGNGGGVGEIAQSGESAVRYALNEKNCGLVHETRIVGGEEANPDDFLWMAAIIKSKPKEGDVRPFCGGALITRRHILTAAHCLEGLAPRDVLVRLGSYDFDDATASSLSADFAIDQFRVPAQYSKKTHAADIAIMRLKTPLTSTDNYKTVCMPQLRRSYVGALGTVTGYGSQSETFRRAAPKLRQVTVPIWENRKCSAVYKRNLTESFLCAGYEEGGKDACQGDSGGPLMTEGPNERMMIVGVVSHGIGCGAPGYPGVYTRTTTFLEWIEKNTRE